MSLLPPQQRTSWHLKTKARSQNTHLMCWGRVLYWIPPSIHSGNRGVVEFKQINSNQVLTWESCRGSKKIHGLSDNNHYCSEKVQLPLRKPVIITKAGWKENLKQKWDGPWKLFQNYYWGYEWPRKKSCIERLHSKYQRTY